MVNDVSMKDSNESAILHHDQYRYTTVQNLHNLSQTFMNLTILFTNQNLLYTCIGLCDRALETMLKALYIKQKGSIYPPHILSLDDLYELISLESGPDLDSVMFVDSIRFLARLKDHSFLQQIKITHFKKLIKKVDDLLCRLSPRVTIHPSDTYQSIFLKITFP
ncbi:hypothetical protein [Paenibacillus sp. IHBB 10380]|uniref:hypothetical protein n=1 Tax=Paenibacillus sp. IHBB 10380 TaxID=1566358 RepID=UPI0005CFD251|nr:hypothetical protein [Paenibacillus sp. IHBB 10380]AJS61189.1 hypothetical protein UB51_25225 [Paenibacillus sp. IHBB 10380]